MSHKNLLLKVVFMSSVSTTLHANTIKPLENNFECFDQHPVGICLINENSKGLVFKILKQEEWDFFHSNGYFKGSADDQRDGFIHLATAAQLHSVIENYFRQENIIYIAAFKSKEFKENLKWENTFPHLYNLDLSINSLKAVVRYQIPIH